MKKNLHIFNPDNDLALAYGLENYTPPAHATRLKHDLSLLPLWYAEGENPCALKYFNGDCSDWVQQISRHLDICTDIVTLKGLQTFGGKFTPWGWSADMRKRLIDNGISPDMLPVSDKIAKIRELSHRRTSILIHNKLNGEYGLHLSPVPVEFTKFEEVCDFAVQYPKCFTKAPWSGSGKGIFRVLDINAVDFSRWISGILTRQKTIICEQPLDKVLDFAMEFKLTDGIARFAGYSVFKNDNHCSYDHGIIADDACLKAMINEYLTDKTLLDKVCSALENIITEIVGTAYNGYLGVDMLLYRTRNGEISINPCIEINLRMTMGMVTNILAKRYLAEGKTGTYHVEFFKNTDLLKARANEIAAVSPVQYSDRKIVSGTQILNPVLPDSRYLAYLKTY